MDEPLSAGYGALMMKSLLSLELAISTLYAGEHVSVSGVERYNVVWDSPSADCHGSMPLGNGDIGLNAWIEPSGDLVFYIGKTDSWEDNVRLAKVGKVRVSSPARIPSCTVPLAP